MMEGYLAGWPSLTSICCGNETKNRGAVPESLTSSSSLDSCGWNRLVFLSDLVFTSFLLTGLSLSRSSSDPLGPVKSSQVPTDGPAVMEALSESGMYSYPVNEFFSQNHHEFLYNHMFS